MVITKDTIEESELLNAGTTCYIMQHGNSTYKIYKGALGYICAYNIYPTERLAEINVYRSTVKILEALEPHYNIEMLSCLIKKQKR